jgi:hypothetical protein
VETVFSFTPLPPYLPGKNATAGKERILISDGGSSRSHYVESWLWNRFGPVVRQTAKRMIE